MNTFEKPEGGAEAIRTPEEIKQRLSELHAEAERLQALIDESGENIDVELGSEAYVDHGYTAQLREEIEPEIASLEAQLTQLEDQAAAQRNLGI